MNAFAQWSQAALAQTEAALDRFLPAADAHPARLHDAIRYAVLGGGKRIRALLVRAAGELTGAPEAALDAVACAVEMIHAYSLVHDDLPCMDNDDLRRGRPTVHKAYDEATALLVGDALQTEAFGLLTQPSLPLCAAQRVRLVAELAQASGSRGMAGGQAVDLYSVGVKLDLPALEAMHRMKTGALLRAAVVMGAVCGDGMTRAQQQALETYAQAIGLAFQVVDDVLDASSDTATLGKTAGKDAAHDKPTYLTLLGDAGARAFAADLHRQARSALDGWHPDGAAASAQLAALADLIVARTH